MTKRDEQTCGCGCGFRTTIQPLFRLHEMVEEVERKAKAKEMEEYQSQCGTGSGKAISSSFPPFNPDMPTITDLEEVERKAKAEKNRWILEAASRWALGEEKKAG